MRRLFSEYGLLAVVMVAGIMAIMMFTMVFFKNDANSLSNIFQVWVNHLI